MGYHMNPWMTLLGSVLFWITLLALVLAITLACRETMTQARASAYCDYVVTWLGDLMKKLYYLSLVSYLPPYHISTESVYRTRIFWGVVLETHANEKIVGISYMLFIHILFDGLRHQGAGIVVGWKLTVRLIRVIRGDEWVMSGQWVGNDQAITLNFMQN